MNRLLSVKGAKFSRNKSGQSPYEYDKFDNLNGPNASNGLTNAGNVFGNNMPSIAREREQVRTVQDRPLIQQQQQQQQLQQQLQGGGVKYANNGYNASSSSSSSTSVNNARISAEQIPNNYSNTYDKYATSSNNSSGPDSTSNHTNTNDTNNNSSSNTASSAAPNQNGGDWKKDHLASYEDKKKINTGQAGLSADAKKSLYAEKYWQMPAKSMVRNSDMVVIHVCDENQQISKDFCCKREILVNSMKYFEKFLSDSEGGYDDIDISVHCDADIFEWLMIYIHDKESLPQIDKSIIVSILISSDFLQMEALVEQCIQQIAANLNDIVKLPIDLSCISEKLINRIAFHTSPKKLTETKDRRDKILTKLYKRRVELDFSRRGNIRTPGKDLKDGVATVPTKTIAASLTCCGHCGLVYLENYTNYLYCRDSPPNIDFRGSLSRQHSSIPGWSLTAYLKSLHSAGMPWDAIYWHVWAACTVLRVKSGNRPMMISLLETDRYTVETDGILVYENVISTNDYNTETTTNDPITAITAASSSTSGSSLPPKIPPMATAGIPGNINASSVAAECGPLPFTLGMDNFTAAPTMATRGGASPISPMSPSANTQENRVYKIRVSELSESLVMSHPFITSTLNPGRSPDILTQEIFELGCSQMRHIVGQSSQVIIKKIVDNIKQEVFKNKKLSGVEESAILGASAAAKYYDQIWGLRNGAIEPQGGVPSNKDPDNETEGKGRSRPSDTGKDNSTRASKYAPTTAIQYNSFPKKPPATGGGGGGGGDVGKPPVPNGLGGDVDSDANSQDSDTDEQNLGARRISRDRASRRSKSQDGNMRRSSSVPAGSSGSKGTFTRQNTSKMAKKMNMCRMKRDSLLNDPNKAQQFSILTALPADVQKKSSNYGSFMHGVWLCAHPLQMQCKQHNSDLKIIDESGLAANKRYDWELDVLREWDERKLCRLERFLSSKRSNLEDPSVTKFRAGGKEKERNAKDKATGKKDDPKKSVLRQSVDMSSKKESAKSFGLDVYYKDRGRQPK